MSITTLADGRIRIKAADLAARKVDGRCTDCHDEIEAWSDPEGVWIECRCDAGYYSYTNMIVYPL